MGGAEHEYQNVTPTGSREKEIGLGLTGNRVDQYCREWADARQRVFGPLVLSRECGLQSCRFDETAYQRSEHGIGGDDEDLVVRANGIHVRMLTQ